MVVIHDKLSTAEVLDQGTKFVLGGLMLPKSILLAQLKCLLDVRLFYLAHMVG